MTKTVKLLCNNLCSYSLLITILTRMCNRNEMTVLARKNEELQQELDAAKKSLKERTRTRRQLEKVLQDAAFAVQSMLAVNICIFTKYKFNYLHYCLASGEDVVSLGVRLSRCLCVRHISLGGEGNALYPVLSSWMLCLCS